MTLGIQDLSKSSKREEDFLWVSIQIDIFMDLAGGHINFGTKVGLETSLLLISQPFGGPRQLLFMWVASLAQGLPMNDLPISLFQARDVL